MPFLLKATGVRSIADLSGESKSSVFELPDSTSLSGTCPRCGNKSSFFTLGTLALTHGVIALTQFRGSQGSKLEVERAAVLQCRHCDAGFVLLEEMWLGDARWDRAESGGDFSWRGIFWWPLPTTSVPQDVPEVIAACYSESQRALAAGCPRAAAVMGRRALEAICAHFNATETNLAKSVEELAVKGVLLPTLAAWSHEVRLVGNKGAHFDASQRVAWKDAEQLLRFVRELLRYLFELPAELQRRRR
jgi:hypothetical protein